VSTTDLRDGTDPEVGWGPSGSRECSTMASGDSAGRLRRRWLRGFTRSPEGLATFGEHGLRCSLYFTGRLLPDRIFVDKYAQDAVSSICGT